MEIALSLVGGNLAEIVYRGTLRGDLAAIDGDSWQLAVASTGKVTGAKAAPTCSPAGPSLSIVDGETIFTLFRHHRETNCCDAR